MPGVWQGRCWWQRSTLVVAFLLALTGCAGTPRGRYGVRNVAVQGVREMSERAITRCLLTRARSEVTITLGIEQEGCGDPPFEHSPPQLALFRSPFADYQPFNRAVVQEDARRIVRFYRARGFYDAEVVAITVDPSYAEMPRAARPKGACNPDKASCPVDVVFVVHEGQPLRVGAVALRGIGALPAAAQVALHRQSLPEQGTRFDESHYDAGKAALQRLLFEFGYGSARVEGRVVLDRAQRRADISYQVMPGPRYRLGRVIVEGHGDLPEAPIVAACGVNAGARYRHSLLEEVQQHVFALGAFSAVEVEPRFVPETGRADLSVRVMPLPDAAWRLGVGVMSGGPLESANSEFSSVPQWDVHLTVRHERRHLLGSLGRLRIEDHPRLVFQGPFPELEHPALGNVLQVRNDQPAVFERLTHLTSSAKWDFGPDPYLGFHRHDVVLRTALSRPFFKRLLLATLALQQDFYLLGGRGPVAADGALAQSYRHRFVEEELQLDLRDQPSEPRQGAYFGVLSRQGLRSPAADFTVLHIGWDARGYLPLPLSMVLAARLATAFLFVGQSAAADERSRLLGPYNYRLRGGGANGNRGFVAGELGVGPEGGLRRLEGSIELRMRLGPVVGLALFGDMGDVRQWGPLSFRLPHPTLGAGLRYRTPIGPIRFDAGFRVGKTGSAETPMPLFGSKGAMHLTIGESF